MQKKFIFLLLFLGLPLFFSLVSASPAYALIDNTNVMFLAVIIISWVIAFVAFIIENEVLGMFAGLILIISGAYFLINGVGDTNTFLTTSWSGIQLGFGAFTFIISGINLMTIRDI